MTIKRNETKQIKLFEVFAGIGSQYQALKDIANSKKWNIKSVGIIEWFIPAIIAYQAIHYKRKVVKKQDLKTTEINLSLDSKTKVSPLWLNKYKKQTYEAFWINESLNKANNFFDIKTTSGQDLPDEIDIFTYSFPCQDISHQGKQNGFDRNSNTRSGLLWEIERLLMEMQTSYKKLPKYLLLENVKAIVNQKHFPVLLSWLERLNDFGYVSQHYVLNSANFGSPQNRERVFVISVLKEHQKQVDFKFPEFKQIKKQKIAIKTVLNSNQNFEPFYNKFNLINKPSTNNNIKKYYLQDYTNFQSESYVYDINHSGPTLTASGAMSRIKLYFGPNQIRSMQPEECFVYMGFKKQAFARVVKTNLIKSNKLIYLAGNSIPVQLLRAIFRSFKF